MAAREHSGSNMTLTRGDQARPQTRRSGQQRSANTRLLNPGIRPHVPHPRTHGRLGSKQIVSYRGRRIAQPAVAKKQLSLTFTVTVVLLVFGVVAAMGLSALSTTQTFTIQRLQAQACWFHRLQGSLRCMKMAVCMSSVRSTRTQLSVWWT